MWDADVAVEVAAAAEKPQRKPRKRAQKAASTDDALGFKIEGGAEAEGEEPKGRSGGARKRAKAAHRGGDSGGNAEHGIAREGASGAARSGGGNSGRGSGEGARSRGARATGGSGRAAADSGAALEERAGAGSKQEALIGAAASGPDQPYLVRFDGGEEFQVPGSINKFLRPYQRDGVRFLLRCYAAGHGGILADDMGLGKTVQAISFCAALLGKTGSDGDMLPREARPAHGAGEAGGGHAEDEDEERGEAGREQGAEGKRWPILVVCPSAVVANWQQELDMWGSFQVYKYHGTTRDTAFRAALSGQAEVLVTTYDTLRHNADMLARLPIHAVIYDEAHKLSNPETQTAKAALKLGTKLRFGLSGTIMPNDFKDLWGLMSLLVPGSLGDWQTFHTFYAKPIKMGASTLANPMQQAMGHKRKVELSELLKRKYLLRRDKTQPGVVEQLPKKVDQIVFCELRPSQKRAYRRIVESPDVQLLARATEVCDCPGASEMRAKCCHQVALPDDGGVMWPHYHLCNCADPACKWHRPEGCLEYYAAIGSNAKLPCPWCLMLPAVQLLRDVANHLDLLRPKASVLDHADPKIRRQAQHQRSVAALAFGDEADDLGGLVAGGSNWVQLTDVQHCGKMVVLLHLLAQWHANGDKVLIFSHRVRMLKIIEAFVQREKYDYLYMDGTVSGRTRVDLVDQFNARQSVFLFLASTSAGGVGLNLTAANRVVVFDPSWDPSKDLQAQDRAYRLGQRRDVHVYRLLGTGTLEEQIYRRQIYKQQQTNQVVYGTTEKRHFEGVQGIHKGELFGMANLLRFTPDKVETADIAAQTAARLAQQSACRHAGAGEGEGSAANAAAAAAAAVTTAAAGGPHASVSAPSGSPRFDIVTLDKPLAEIIAENKKAEGDESSSGDESDGDDEDDEVDLAFVIDVDEVVADLDNPKAKASGSRRGAKGSGKGKAEAQGGALTEAAGRRGAEHGATEAGPALPRSSRGSSPENDDDVSLSEQRGRRDEPEGQPGERSRGGRCREQEEEAAGMGEAERADFRSMLMSWPDEGFDQEAPTSANEGDAPGQGAADGGGGSSSNDGDNSSTSSGSQGFEDGGEVGIGRPSLGLVNYLEQEGVIMHITRHDTLVGHDDDELSGVLRARQSAEEQIKQQLESPGAKQRGKSRLGRRPRGGAGSGGGVSKGTGRPEEMAGHTAALSKVEEAKRADATKVAGAKVKGKAAVAKENAAKAKAAEVWGPEGGRREGEMEVDGQGPFLGYSVSNPPPLEKLPSVCRGLFELAKLYGMTPQEMAQQLLGMPREKVESTLAAGRQLANNP